MNDKIIDKAFSVGQQNNHRVFKCCNLTCKLPFISDKEFSKWHEIHHNEHMGRNNMTTVFVDTPRTIQDNGIYCTAPCDNGNAFLRELMKEYPDAGKRRFDNVFCKLVSRNQLECGLRLPTNKNSKMLIQYRLAHRAHHKDNHLMLHHSLNTSYTITDDGKCSEPCFGPESAIKGESILELDACSLLSTNGDINIYSCGMVFPKHTSGSNYRYYNAQHFDHHNKNHTSKQLILPTNDGKICPCEGTQKKSQTNRKVLF